MAKFVIVLEPVNATPKNFPVNQLLKLHPRLKKYLERDLGPKLRQDMEKTVQNWKTKPNMVQTVSNPYGTRLQLVVQPKGKGTTNWKRISEGTGPRTIKAKSNNPKGMSFQTGYTPHTRPGGRWGGPGRRHGPWRRGVRLVKNHVIKPRKFAPIIMKKHEKGIHRDVRNIVRRVSKL